MHRAGQELGSERAYVLDKTVESPDRDLQRRAALNLAGLALATGDPSRGLLEALSMLGLDEALRSTESAAAPKGRHPLRDCLGRTRTPRSGRKP